jgi:predicted SnoaL-like aldol condensation-catalyzing enzyme
MTKCTATRALALAAFAAAVSGCAASTAALMQERAKSNTQTVLAFEETVFNKHQVQEGFEHYVGPIYREHDPHGADGRDAAIHALTQLITQYPNSRVTVARTIAQGNLVAVQLVWTLQAAPQTSARIDVYRLEEGRITEHWDVTEALPGSAVKAVTR